MMTGLRRHLGWLSRLMVVVMAVVSLGPLVHHDPGHDPDCDPLLILHDESQHRFTSASAAGTPSPADHCAVCHWGRSFRGPVRWTSLSAPHPDARLAVDHAVDRAPAAPPLPLVPARAPPTA